MGYETHFRLKGELDDKFKSWMKDSRREETQEYKDILVATCLKSYIKDNDYTALVKARRAISFAVRIYVNFIGEHWKMGLMSELEKNNNETWFCGWECARNESTWTSEQEIVDWFTSQLFMDAIAPYTYDLDTKEDSTRMQNIKDLVEDIEDSVRDLWRYLFIERYRDSEDAWESDGYDRKYPEEVEENDDEDLVDPPAPTFDD